MNHRHIGALHINIQMNMIKDHAHSMAVMVLLFLLASIQSININGMHFNVSVCG